MGFVSRVVLPRVVSRGFCEQGGITRGIVSRVFCEQGGITMIVNRGFFKQGGITRGSKQGVL